MDSTASSYGTVEAGECQHAASTYSSRDNTQMKRPRLYVVFGIPFSGKSTIVRELVRQRGCRAIDIDAINTARGVGTAGAVITPADWEISFARARAQLDDALAARASRHAALHDSVCLL